MIVFEILRLTFYLGNSRQRIDGELRSKTWFIPATLRCLLNNSLLIFWARNLFNNYSPTLRWIIVLVYSKPVKSQWQKMNVIWSLLARARVHCVLQTSNIQWVSRAWVANQSATKWIFTGLVYTKITEYVDHVHCGKVSVINTKECWRIQLSTKISLFKFLAFTMHLILRIQWNVP